MPERLRAPDPGLLVAICVLGVLGAAGAVVLRVSAESPGPDPGLQAALLDWIVISYLVSGSIAWWRRPDNRFGPLMIAAGVLTLLSSLSSASGALPFTVGVAFDLVPFALFIHVFLAFPTGRLRTTFERLIVASAYLFAIGMQLIGLMLGGFRPDNVLAVVEEPDLALQIFDIQLVALAALALLGIVALALRRISDPQPRRRAAALLVDLFVVALLMCAALLITGTFFPGSAFLWIQRATFFLLGLAPIAFLIALLDARLARSSVGDLLVELRADPAPADLREPLARALNDPSLELAYWLPQMGGWSDAEGRPVTLPADGDGRGVMLIQREGEDVAALIHHPALDDEPELLEAVSAAAGIALENGRLQAELKARLEEVKSSRERVLAAGQEERKRLERNLHDGAQQRLVTLSLELGMLSKQLGDDAEAQARIVGAKGEIMASLDELRQIARGLHPATLTSHGLEAALSSVAAHAAVPVDVNVDLDGRLEEAVEVTVYYVVSEALANVGKHAKAGGASIDVSHRDGMLVVEVADDGVGGADAASGSGLTGLSDRVAALGGELEVRTPAAGGTKVRAEVPCEPL